MLAFLSVAFGIWLGLRWVNDGDSAIKAGLKLLTVWIGVLLFLFLFIQLTYMGE